MPRKSSWSTKEVNYLKENWSKSTGKEIALYLGKRVQECYDKASSLGLKKDRRKARVLTVAEKRAINLRINVNKPKWTVSEVNFLKDNIGVLSDKEISKVLGKTVPAIYCKRRSLSKVKNLHPVPDVVEVKKQNNHFKAWSKKEEKLVKDNFNKISIKDLAKQLGRTEDAIKGRAYTLGLIPKSEERPRTKWTKEEVKYIKKHINSKTYEEIGEYLGRSSAAIASKASSLKISKSPLRTRKTLSFSKIGIISSIGLNLGLISYIIYSIIK